MRKSSLSIVAAGLAASLSAGQAIAVDMSRYVSIGDSLTAGYISGGLVETTQKRDYPALIAASGGASASFQQPTISEPGIPPIYYLKSLVPLIIERKPGTGQPTNLQLPRPYSNLGVPGAISLDVLQTVSDPDNPYFDLVLRGQGTMLQQAAALSPTFLSVWIGSNDILGAALSGVPVDGVTMTPIPAFQQIMGLLFQQLAGYKGRVIVGNVPDVTTIAFTTAISIYITNPATGLPVLINGQKVPLIGPGGTPLVQGSYVLLTASSYMQQGYGIPVALGGNGQPLPNEVVLTPDEVIVIRQHVDAFNQTIASLAAQQGIPVVDINSILKGYASKGVVVGGVPLTIAFVTGGLFSLDGVHPSDVGYAIIANEFISKINSSFNASLPLVDLNAYLGIASRAHGGSFDWSSAGFTDEMFENLKQIFLKPAAREYLERMKSN